MIAMDMDGTLLTNDKKVTKRTMNAIEKASQKGIKIVVCTGRIFTSAKIFANIIGTKAPIIASNGAYIREKDRNEVVYEKLMNKEQLHSIIKMVKEYKFYPHLYTFDTIYTEKIIFSSESYSKWNESLPENERIKIEVVNDLLDIAQQKNILKAMVMSNDTNNLLKLRKEIDEKMDISIVSSLPNNFEIMDSGVSKGSAVEILANYYGIKRDEVICIGDNENDLSMINYANLGVAMGNAEKILKDSADYITDTNENDGVAKVIEKFMLEV